MRIVHLSDIHLTQNGYEIWETNTMDHFNRAIELISELENIDAIIVTGDLSNDGSEWTYRYIDKAFQKVGIPTYCCPGNHDDIGLMLNEYHPLFYHIEPCAKIGGYKFVILNSAIPEMSRGELGIETFQFLRQQLDDLAVPTIISFHHPAIEPGGWLSRKLLENRKDFNDLIENYPNVKMVLYGHLHYNIQHIINEVIYSAAPSVGFAFDKDLPKFQIAKGQEGFNLITIENEQIKIETVKLYSR